ncbi:hypothetical protein FACS189494_03230 [Spirochaetia bacterium]|nr:hypothetical protein FACS189494_03230 [Spirochaetia bacterium]
MSIIKIDEKLIYSHLAKYRNLGSNTQECREAIHNASLLLVPHISKELDYSYNHIPSQGKDEKIFELDSKLVLVVIKRAGNFMQKAFTKLLHAATIVSVTTKRTNIDTLDIVDFPLSEITEESKLIIIDPIIGTGKTMIKVLDNLQNKISFKNIIIATLMAGKRGLDNIQNYNDEVKVYSCYELPNLECFAYPRAVDIGDRLCGSIPK